MNNLEVMTQDWQEGNNYFYSMKWKDNPFVFFYEADNLADMLKVKTKLESRMQKHFESGSDFITSDIEDLQYIEV